MAIEVDWTIKIGTVNSPTDFTSRVKGLSILQPLGFMQPAAHRCTITLDNNDGALTPGAGGTYGSVNWFAQGLFITATVNTTDTANVFHGIVNDFDIADDGVTSTVTITAADWLTIGARATYQTSASSGGDFPFTQRLAASADAFTRTQGVNTLPLLGNTAARTQYTFTENPRTTGEVAAGSVIMATVRNKNDTLLDVYTTREQAGVPSVLWPTTITEGEREGEPGVTYTRYNHATVGDLLSRNTNKLTFTFVEQTPSTGELPIAGIDRGYNVERAVNVAKITSAYTTNESQASNQNSADLSGAQQILVTQSSMQYDTDVARMAANLVDRFGTVRFQARSLTVGTPQLATLDASMKDEVAALLDVDDGLWQEAVVKYTPTGAASQQTDVSVIFGRRIDAVPGRTTITIELLPAVDYQSFVLDSSTLGVLDQNRLG